MKSKTLQQAIEKQEKWRQKQIYILYDTGRPIFPDWKKKVESPITPMPPILQSKLLRPPSTF